MITCNCPRCDEGFRVPSGRIPEDAHARCPWCHESYPIADVLRHLPPMLEITSADGTPISLDDEAAHGMGSGLASGVGVISRPQLPVRGESIEAIVESVPGDDLEFSDFQGSEGLASAMNETASEPIEEIPWSPASSDSFAENNSVGVASGNSNSDWDQDSPLESMNLAGAGGNRAKRKGAGIGTFIGIVLGGLASVPIAGFLLMLLGQHPDWGFWPFDGGTGGEYSRAAEVPPSKASDPLPAAEPRNPNSSLSGEPLRYDSNDGILDTDTSSIQAQVDKVQSDADQILGSKQSQQNARDPTSSSADELPASDGSANESDGEADGTRSNEPPQSLPEAAVGETPQANSGPQADSADQADSGPLDANGEEYAYSRAASNNTESAKLAERAGRMIEEIRDAEYPAAERNRRLTKTYMTIVQSAGLVDEPIESLRILAAVISDSPDREALGKAGWKWLRAGNRETDGIALIGQIVMTDGKPTLTDGAGGTVSLIGDVEFEDGQKTLILGRIVEPRSVLRVYAAEPVE